MLHPMHTRIPYKVAAAAATLVLACTAVPAFGAQTIIDRDGATAETVLTGKVGKMEDVISVVLPSNIKMTIKTDKQGHLDEQGTQDTVVNVENESSSTRDIKLVLYKTTDEQSLLDEVTIMLNGQDITQAKGNAATEVPLTDTIRPGTTDTLTMSAAPIRANQVITEGTRNVRTIIKATIA